MTDVAPDSLGMIKKEELPFTSRAEYLIDNQYAIGGISSIRGGKSTGQYASLNLGLNTNDDAERVAENRRLFFSEIMPTAEVCYLIQTHSARVVDADGKGFQNGEEGDALFTFSRGKLLSITVADCGNILLYQPGLCCAAIHAGWRGANDGIVRKTIELLAERGASPDKLLAVIGPMIRQRSYQVGCEFADIFPSKYLQPDNDRFQLNLPQFIYDELVSCGISTIYDCGEDTYSLPAKYYSYRRSSDTGRMSAFIALR